MDSVSTLGNGVNGAVRSIGTQYDSQGNPYLVTSFSGTNGTGAIVNQVEDVFNGYGDVTAEYQAVNGGVNIGTTPVVQYTYSNGGNNAEQLLSTVYPDGYTVKDNYSGTTDNAISRISSLTDGNGNLIEGYTYQGVDTVLGRTQAVQSLSTTLDNFGNVAEQKWTSGTTVNSDYKYTYDADNNVVSRADQVDPTRSQTYTYDGLNQLVSYTEGGAGAQSYSYDTLGNRLGVTTGGSTVTSGANAQNQVTNVDGTPLSYDNDGNMTKDQNGANYYWDAWNRLVVIATNTTVESFSYDGESRLVTDTVATTAGGTTTNRYYSNQDQVLDESVGSNWTARYVWSPVYVNALIFRDTPASGTRVWAEQDANYNVVALVGASGAVMERIDYSGFGVLSTVSGGVTNWVYGWQGMRVDGVTNWVESETRWYSPSVGVWTSVDPLGFGGGDVREYGFEGNGTVDGLDPSGEWFFLVPVVAGGALLLFGEGCSPKTAPPAQEAAVSPQTRGAPQAPAAAPAAPAPPAGAGAAAAPVNTGVKNGIDWATLSATPLPNPPGSTEFTVHPAGVTGKTYTVKTTSGIVLKVFEADPAANQPAAVRGLGAFINSNCHGTSAKATGIVSGNRTRDFSIIDTNSALDFFNDQYQERPDPKEAKAALDAGKQVVILFRGPRGQPFHSATFSTIILAGVDLDVASAVTTKNGFEREAQTTVGALLRIYPTSSVSMYVKK